MRRRANGSSQTRGLIPSHTTAAEIFALVSGGGKLGRGGMGGWSGLLPLAETAAEQGCGAAFAAEDDDVILQREVGVPGNEPEVTGGDDGKDPVVGGFLLNSTNASKQVCRGHTSLLKGLNVCETQQY